MKFEKIWWLAIGLGLAFASALIWTRNASVYGPTSAQSGPVIRAMGSKVSPARGRRPDALAALRLSLQESDPGIREDLVQEWIAAIPFHELGRMVRALRGSEDVELFRDVCASLLARWAREDIQSAVNHLEQIQSKSDRQSALITVAIEWANQDLDSAVDWSKNLPDPAERSIGSMTVASEGLRENPVSSIKLLLELENSSERDELMQRAAAEWASASPAEAIAWAQQIPDDQRRANILGAIATLWSEVDPVGAANLAIQNLGPGERRNETVVGIVQRWAQHAPALAASWVLQFPLGDLRDVCTENLVTLWTEHDAIGVGNWLGELEPGMERDLAIRTYARQLTTAFPNVARSWAMSIDDADIRKQACQTIASIP